MQLTKDEEDILAGESGAAKQKAMEILVALGEIYEAEKLVPIESAQIAGVSYKTIGEAGLEYLTELNGTVAVPTMLNPMGMDRNKWGQMGIDETFVEKQLSIITRYELLGIDAQCTCTPYYVNAPRYGAHISWAESSAVAYANSVLGARTNREGGPSALAAALVGKTPDYGYHRDENRIPNISVRTDFHLSGSDFGALGYAVGKMVKSRVPQFSFLAPPNADELKALGAAMAATGSVALFSTEKQTMPREVLEIDRSDVDVYSSDEPEVVVLGCPHCSRSELAEIAHLLDGRKVVIPLWICTSRFVAGRSSSLISRIEASGACVICDTCMIVSPAFEKRTMMVNSGKALEYGPSMCNSATFMGTTAGCIAAACGA
ncbi:MAG TPA: aconitase X catalytic domain-containing protein [Candidatus Bathyarchaeia archaeon]|nr:aconitase X catalytic domain-containing protein [Candidatus Bathyarchaeia archaeon]